MIWVYWQFYYRVRKVGVDPAPTQWEELFEKMIMSEAIQKDVHQIHFIKLDFWRDSKGHKMDQLFPSISFNK